jgi:hypothetical protein
MKASLKRVGVRVGLDKSGFLRIVDTVSNRHSMPEKGHPTIVEL